MTPEAREAFKLYVAQWQEKLGLQDWRINVSNKPAPRHIAATVHHQDVEARLANIRLGTDFGNEPVDDTTLADTAVHELLHVFLHEFKQACLDRRTESEIFSAEHRVIHTLVNLLVHGR